MPQFRLIMRISIVCTVMFLSPIVHADYDAIIYPGTSWGTWEGWGTSLAGWANTFGDSDVFADIFFTLNNVDYNGVQVPGLGMNIVRYNAGACSWNVVNSDAMVESPNIPAFKQIESYWLDWLNTDPASASWDWSVDATQRNMVKKAQSRGANLIELFSNSPPWWMLYNHNPSGAPDGGDNLTPWNYQQHAVYMATVAKYAHDNWGIDFTTVTAFNEPSANWWKADGTQEGCHISASYQQEIIQYLRAELNNRGLNFIDVSSSDESLYDQAVSTWNSFSSTTKGSVTQVNVHGYQYENGRRDALYTNVHADGKVLWQSEFGDGEAEGMRLASNLQLDMKWLHPTAWSYWQVLDYGGWGLIQADGSNGWMGPVNSKYYVVAQYARHIRRGMRIIDSSDSNTAVAYDATAKRLVIVTVNYGTAQYINYDLSQFSQVTGATGGLVRRWATNTGNTGKKYVAFSDTYLSGKVFWSWFEVNTVQTFEVDNVVI